IDPLADLADSAREQIFVQTTEVRTTLSKVRQLANAVIRSTTLALPAWARACQAKNLPVRQIPRDVKTRWNSTYHMLRFAFDYCSAIDAITADK
ncbi:uncharacterized protein B0H18DRAFT_845661, partial [Fomitopsis serialis]|uniref:uncharacterized protein n=1 Tax=Fomitopsis serialis TaxID=139415 RepID=UPI002008CF2D